MTEANATLDIIRDRLREAFHPTALEIIDDSHLHHGHPGAKDGGAHFTVTIASSAFQNKPLIVQHRLVYEVLADLIPSKVHALKLQTRINL